MLRNAGAGFIVNSRNDGIRLHRAGCEAVGVTISLAYPKRFFETYEDAVRWTTEEYGPRWTHCDKCVLEVTRDMKL